MEYKGNEKEREQELPCVSTKEQGMKSLVGHLAELRSRFIRGGIAWAIGTVIIYYFAEEIVKILTAPAGILYYMGPAEAFLTYMKVSVFGGFSLALPILLYEAWRFVSPALTEEERRIVQICIPVGIILFVFGIAFGYYAVLPAGMSFFLGFTTDSLQPLLSVGRYIDFVLTFLLPFGFLFELPLILFISAKMDIVRSEGLRKKRKYMIVGAFIIGGVVSPTADVFTQTMMALPIILLYEISYWIMRVIMRK